MFARLAVVVVGTAAVVDAHLAIERLAECLEAIQFLRGDLVLARVAEDEDVEVALRSLPDKAAAHALEGGEDGLGIFRCRPA